MDRQIVTSNGMTFVLSNVAHLEQHADVFPFLPEALELFSQQRSKSDPPFVAHAVDLGRIVGETVCVPTAPGDDVFFAQREGRRWPTRFVRGKSPIPVSSIAIAVKRLGDMKHYRLLTAYIGRHAPREVGDLSLRRATPEQRAESELFWSNHALIADTQILSQEQHHVE